MTNSPIALFTDENFAGSLMPENVPSIILFEALQDVSSDTKIQLVLAAARIHKSDRDMHRAAASICLAVFQIRQIIPLFWDTFCLENFNFSDATCRRYCSTGEMINKQIAKGNVGLDDFAVLSRRALEIMKIGSDDAASKFLEGIKDISAGGEIQQKPINSVMVRATIAAHTQLEVNTAVGEVERLKQELAAANLQISAAALDRVEDQDALNRSNAAVERLSEQVHNAEQEVIATRVRLTKVQNSQPTSPTKVDVIAAPPSIVRENEKRAEQLRAQIENLDHELAKKQGELEKSNSTLRKVADNLSRTQDASAVLEDLKSDIGDLLIKYPRSLIEKLIAADPRITHILQDVAGNIGVLATQIQP